MLNTNWVEERCPRCRLHFKRFWHRLSSDLKISAVDVRSVHHFYNVSTKTSGSECILDLGASTNMSYLSNGLSRETNCDPG